MSAYERDFTRTGSYDPEFNRRGAYDQDLLADPKILTGPQTGQAVAAVVNVAPGTATAVPGAVSAAAVAATVNVTPGTATGQAKNTAAASSAVVNVAPGAATGVPGGVTGSATALPVSVTPGTATRTPGGVTGSASALPVNVQPGTATALPGSVTGVASAALVNVTLPAPSVIGGNQFPNDPIAWWALDDGSGTTAHDSSGNGHDATLTGGNWSTDAKFGGAFDLSGDVANFTSISLGSVYSASLWIKKQSTGDGVLIGGASGDYILYIDGTDLYSSAGLGNFAQVAHSSFVGVWHHLALVRNGVNVKFYLDGVQLGTTQTITNNTISVAAFGAYADGSFPIDGVLDEVRIYDRALTDAEVLALYQQPYIALAMSAIVNVQPGAASTILLNTASATALPVNVLPGSATAIPGGVTRTATALPVSVLPGSASALPGAITRSATSLPVNVSPGTATGLPKITTTAIAIPINVSPGIATGKNIQTGTATAITINVVPGTATRIVGPAIGAAQPAVISVSLGTVTVTGGIPVVVGPSGPPGYFISSRFTKRRKAIKYPIQPLELFLVVGADVLAFPVVVAVQTVTIDLRIGAKAEIAGLVTFTLDLDLGYTVGCEAERIGLPVEPFPSIASGHSIALASHATASHRNEREELLNDTIDLMDLYEATGDRSALDALQDLMEDVVNHG